jgi:hypothetical protein
MKLTQEDIQKYANKEEQILLEMLDPNDDEGYESGEFPGKRRKLSRSQMNSNDIEEGLVSTIEEMLELWKEGDAILENKELNLEFLIGEVREHFDNAQFHLTKIIELIQSDVRLKSHWERD